MTEELLYKLNRLHALCNDLRHDFPQCFVRSCPDEPTLVMSLPVLSQFAVQYLLQLCRQHGTEIVFEAGAGCIVLQARVRREPTDAFKRLVEES